MARRTKKEIERDKNIYAIVQSAIRAQGIEKVRSIVFHGDAEAEGVAMCHYINTRMAKKELQDKLEEAGFSKMYSK